MRSSGDKHDKTPSIKVRMVGKGKNTLVKVDDDPRTMMLMRNSRVSVAALILKSMVWWGL